MEQLIQTRTMASIFNREIPLISEENSFDPNRDSYGKGTNDNETEIAPIAYLAGEVNVTYDGDPARQLGGCWL